MYTTQCSCGSVGCSHHWQGISFDREVGSIGVPWGRLDPAWRSLPNSLPQHSARLGGPARVWPSSLLQPRLVRDGDPASKGPGGALGFLRCQGALTQHLILTCPAQPNCWGTGGVSGDGTTRLPQWASIGTLIHSMTLETTERVGRNAVQNILQSKNAWLVVWKVCLCVSPEYSVVRPPGVVLRRQ